MISNTNFSGLVGQPISHSLITGDHLGRLRKSRRVQSVHGSRTNTFGQPRLVSHCDWLVQAVRHLLAGGGAAGGREGRPRPALRAAGGEPGGAAPGHGGGPHRGPALTHAPTAPTPHHFPYFHCISSRQLVIGSPLLYPLQSRVQISPHSGSRSSLPNSLFLLINTY